MSTGAGSKSADAIEDEVFRTRNLTGLNIDHTSWKEREKETERERERERENEEREWMNEKLKEKKKKEIKRKEDSEGK